MPVEGRPTTGEDADVIFDLMNEVAMLRVEFAKLKATIQGKGNKVPPAPDSGMEMKVV